MDDIREFQGEYRWLSNFVGETTTPKGTVCKTVEHAFQAAKTVISAEQKCVLACNTPGQAKRAGRKVTMRPDWENIKVRVMAKLVRAKFLLDSKLAARLVATGDVLLLEGNRRHDNFWGECRCPDCCDWSRAYADPYRVPEGNEFYTTNLLGRILMDVRDGLVTGEYTWERISCWVAPNPGKKDTVVQTLIDE